jgi:hypothetical protein
VVVVLLQTFVDQTLWDVGKFQATFGKVQPTKVPIISMISTNGRVVSDVQKT